MAAISANEKPQKNFRSTTSASSGSISASSSSASLIRGQLVGVGNLSAISDGRVELEIPAALLGLAVRA